MSTSINTNLVCLKCNSCDGFLPDTFKANICKNCKHRKKDHMSISENDFDMSLIELPPPILITDPQFRFLGELFSY